MKKFRMTAFGWLAMTFIALTIIGCGNKKQEQKEKYAYESAADDPLNARIYTLSNGLKVYLTVNRREPRIQTYFAVKAGSKNDPAETTGLAHYLEHMLFKGSSQIGTINWEMEKPLLDQISDLYEQHKATDDLDEKKAIYKIIDSLSHEASKYAVPNEYDKMISSLGAEGTNAYTWVEQTVYVNDIPANELEKWMYVESARFRELELRLFHTELETVYEEFNRAQDNDHRKSWKAVFEGLYPNHPYGTQTTLGKGEHLKNPSMVNIHNYFDTYYVPNNIAICLSGDLDPDKTVEMIEKYFGDWKRKEVPEFKHDEQPEIKEPIVKEAFGSQPEHLYMGFRFAGAGTQEADMLRLIDGILSNGQAGLIDLDLVQKQTVLSAASTELTMADYSAHILYGEPREGQTLEQVKDLLLEEIEKIKKGDFDDWLLSAVVKNLKLQQMKSYEKNDGRAHQFVSAFTMGQSWDEVVHEFDRMEKITKAELVAFANEHYKDNYVVVYKRTGKDPDVYKVDKPQITPIVINRDTQSAFVAGFDTIQAGRLEPLFLDFKEAISTKDLGKGVSLSYIKNEFNDLFELHYVFDMGTNNDKELGLAINYLPYLGTDKYTAEDLQKEFFKLGLSFGVNSGDEKVYVTLSGLEESLEDGLKLFEHILANVQPDEKALDDMVDGILKSRSDAKLDKGTILRQAMMSYGKYGPESPFTNILSEKELKTLKAEKLTEKIKQLSGYKHKVFYYGKMPVEKTSGLLAQYHKINSNLKDYPTAKAFPELPTTDNKVYVVDYDMVQSEMLLMSKLGEFNKDMVPYNYVFFEYFGAGLSSIVFQEIREAKALAYAAYAYVSTPPKKDKAHYVYAYLGTQADKLPDAVDAMIALMNNMPEADRQFNAAKDAAMKKIESERIVGSDIFWEYEKAKDRGLDSDIRRTIYQKLPDMQIGDLKQYFDTNIKGRNYTFLVLGKKESLDLKVLSKLGKVEELSLPTIFNY